jgi:hypothetical protein
MLRTEEEDDQFSIRLFSWGRERPGWFVWSVIGLTWLGHFQSSWWVGPGSFLPGFFSQFLI